MAVGIPSKLSKLLAESQFEAATLALARASESILDDNKMPFFPGYTDHGSAHVQAVFAAAQKLIPEQAWEQGLEPPDAAVLIGATFLHDLALHIRERGFVALIDGSTPHRPLPWFERPQENRAPDEPWPELWQSFRKQAQRFSQSQFDQLFGARNADLPAVALGEPDPRPDLWTENDRLLIGEFLRRHHARLAHEIAMYGFPGLPEFPILADTMPELANAVGVAARSHNEDLRVAAEYLAYVQPGDQRPYGSALVFLMGVLRIADYFQIEAARASPLLLHLRDPQSPQSIAEWRKHHAVQRISWANTDPMAVNIQISPAHDLKTHLRLAELIEDLQSEMDLTTAVLSETYGRSELDSLQLSRQRVRTNLFEDGLREQLGYVPEAARMRSAPDLFRLVVSDLYGNEPVVAGRELLQNAVDAVRERERWEARTGAKCDPLDLYEISSDVHVELRQDDAENAVLRIVDRGIGMTPSTVIDSFLTAGVSFGAPHEDGESDAATAVRWMKAGRFGIGAFAAFLLGPRVKVVTRHVGSSRGIEFTADFAGDLIQLNRVRDIPIGTLIEVPFDTSVFEAQRAVVRMAANAKGFLREIAYHYGLSSPRATFRLVSPEGDIEDLDWNGLVPTPGSAPAETESWISVPAVGFDAVYWRQPPSAAERRVHRRIHGRVVHNGIAIRRPFDDGSRDSYRWSTTAATETIERPGIAVFDTQHRLGVTLNRYELTEESLPFEDEVLRSVSLDVVAHALAGGKAQHPLGLEWTLKPVASPDHWFPLLPGLAAPYLDQGLCTLWTAEGMSRSAGQEATDLFLSHEAGADQRFDAPFRTALPLSEDFLDEEDEDDHEHWGLGPRRISSSTGLLNAWLRHELLLGVIVHQSKAGAHRTMMWYGGRGGWNRGSAGAGAPFHETQDEAARSVRKQLHGLAGTAEELIERCESGALGLTVSRLRPDAQTLGYDQIAAPWAELIGGPLERDEEMRRARSMEIVKGNDELGVLVGRWEKLLARPAAA